MLENAPLGARALLQGTGAHVHTVAMENLAGILGEARVECCPEDVFVHELGICCRSILSDTQSATV